MSPPHVTKLMIIIKDEMSRDELQDILKLEDRKPYSDLYLKPAIVNGLCEMTESDKPRRHLQKYRLTATGKNVWMNAGEE